MPKQTTGNEPSLSLSHLTPGQRQLLTDLADIFAAQQRRTSEPSLILLSESDSRIPASALHLEALLQRPLNPDNKRDKTQFHHGFDITLFTHQGDQQRPAPDLEDPSTYNEYMTELLSDWASNRPRYSLYARLTPRPGCTLQYLGQIPYTANSPAALQRAHLWHLAIPDRRAYYLTSRTPDRLQYWENPNPWNLPHFDLRFLMTGLDPKPLPEHLTRFCLDLVADQIQQSINDSTSP